MASNYLYLITNDSVASIEQDEVIYYSKAYSYDISGRLISESITQNLYSGVTLSSEIVFLYDENSMIGMQYTSPISETSIYYYFRNLMGDVIALYDANGNKVVEYLYDAWGNCTIKDSTTNYTIAHVNPIRYRGYYYDEDTKLYYLNARYYSPEFRRFISPDDSAYLDPENPSGLNLYAYCYNDPVNYYDPSGHSTSLIIGLIGLGIGIILGLGYATYTDYQDDGDFNGSIGWQAYAGYAMFGGAIGFVIGYYWPAITSFFGSSFTFKLPVFSKLIAGESLALAGSTTVTVTGAQVTGGALVANLGIMLFAKGGLPNNQHQNEQWREAMRRLDIKDKDLWRRLHDEIHKYPYQNNLKDLLKLLREILQKWGKL